MSLSPREATLPSPTHPSHTLCCHRAVPDSLHCLPRPLSSHTFSPPPPRSHCPHFQATPLHLAPRSNCCPGVSQSSCKPTCSVGLQPLPSCPVSVPFLPHKTPLPRAERLSAISNRQRELPQKSSVRGADGRSRPREAKACPRLSLLGVSNIPHHTPRPLYQPCPPTPELLPAKDQALRSSATSGPVSLGWRWWNLSVRGWASEACRKVNICA